MKLEIYICTILMRTIKSCLFDIFPDPVGMFVEIEAGGEENLKSTVEKLGLMNCPLESRNYGQIIRETTAGNNRLMFK